MNVTSTLHKILLIGLSLILLTCPVSAEKRKSDLDKQLDVLIKRLVKGEIFLGGQPPRLKNLSVIQEIEKDGKFYYRLKALVERSSGDSNGSLILFKAKTYGHAFAKLFNIDPANKRLFDTFFPKSIDKTRFPPVQMVYEYELITRNSENNRLVSSEGKRRPKGKNRFIESFSQGLPPGKHEVIINVSVDIGEHPIKSMFDLLEWIEFLADPVGSVIDSLAEYTEYFSVIGIGKALLKHVIETKATKSQATFQIEVLAKVPDVRGLLPSKAVQALAARLLGYNVKNTSDCALASANKVIRQNPAPGKRLRKDQQVTLVICREGSSQPTPTPTTGDTYAAWIAPDKLTCCTTPDGIYTYAYQSGLERSKPANGILLQGGFATPQALVSWVCNRPVHYHYWAGNWANINGYTVSQLPCSINS